MKLARVISAIGGGVDRCHLQFQQIEMFPCANDSYGWKTFMSHGWLLSWLLQQRVYHCDGATDSTLKITSSDAQKYLQSKSYYYYHRNTSSVSKRASGSITLSYFFFLFTEKHYNGSELITIRCHRIRSSH